MMIPEKNALNNRQIFLIILAGTVVRFFYGMYGRFWMSAPDQLAWGISLEDILNSGTVSYKQLIHYPHEGGSFILSLLALAFKPIDGVLPALSLAALFLDTLSRWIQIRLSVRLFNTKTAFWFGLWTIISVPLLLPWSTVNFGLHSLASFWPFIFLYCFSVMKIKKGWGILNGILTGLAISFSYDSIILIPVFFIGSWLRQGTINIKIKETVEFILALLISLSPHIILRYAADNGFQLEQLSAIGVRGIDWKGITFIQFFENCNSILTQQLPSSIFMMSTFVSADVQRFIVLAFMVTAFLIALFNKRKVFSNIILPFLILLAFIILLAAGPFFTEFRANSGYVYYRYFTFILPLLVAMMIYTFQSPGKINRWILYAWISVCVFFTVMHISEIKPSRELSYEAAGWILARKYGDNLTALQRMSTQTPMPGRKDLIVGYGWGLTAILLQGKNANDTSEVRKLETMFRQFPVDNLPLLNQGVEKAFSPGTTPVLDSVLLNDFRYRTISGSYPLNP